jgi:hypothetical protein
MGKGKIKRLSNNPHDDGTLIFKGKSHAKGGIDINYNGQNVEVEGEETFFKGKDGSLHIMGNMKVPNSNEKFKNVMKTLAGKEAAYQKIMEKGEKTLDSRIGRGIFAKIKQDTGELMMRGANMGMKDISDKKERLANLQNEMLQMANTLGMDAVAMSEGKNKQAKWGMTANAGKTIPVDDDFNKRLKAKLAKVEGGDNGYLVPSRARNKQGTAPMAFGKYQMVRSTRHGLYKSYFKGQYKNFDDFEQAYHTIPAVQEQAMTALLTDARAQFGDDETAVILNHRVGPSVTRKIQRDPRLMNVPIKQLVPGSPDTETAANYLKKTGMEIGSFMPSSADPNEVAKLLKLPKLPPSDDELFGNVTLANANTNLPKEKPTAPLVNEQPVMTKSRKYTFDTDNNTPEFFQKKLSPLQIAPEVLALATERAEAVPAQKYMPELMDQYQISYQDRVNENVGALNNLKRGVGEGVLSSLLAETYRANSLAQAEESRINQQVFNTIYNENQKIINDAIGTNLRLADVQMERQSKAKSITKANIYGALNSISNKLISNEVDNFDSALKQTMFNFRPEYNEKGEFVGMKYKGPDQQFGQGEESSASQQRNQTVTERTDTPAGSRTVRTESPLRTEQQELRLFDQKVDLFDMFSNSGSINRRVRNTRRDPFFTPNINNF